MIVIPGGGIIPDFDVPKQRNFDNFLRAYMEYTEGQEASPTIHFWTCLSIVAGVLGRKVWLYRDHYDTFPNLYVVIVGAPGLVKKSTATGIGVDLLREIPGFQLSPEQTSDAALVDAMQRSERKYIIDGVEQRHSALFYHGSELSVMFKGSYGAIAEMFIEFYDCKPRNPNKPWTRESRMGGKVEVYGPCLNMLGCTTPRALKDIVSIDNMDGGFASRVNFILIDEKPEKFHPIPDQGNRKIDMQKKLIQDLMYISTLQGRMKMTKEARELFSTFYIRNQEFIFKNREDSRFIGYFARKPIMVEKLAMICSACGRDDLVIEEDDINFAIKELEKAEKPMLEKFQHIGRNELGELTFKVLAFVRERRRVPISAVSARFVNDLSNTELNSVLAQLYQMQAVKLVHVGSSMSLIYTGEPDQSQLEDQASP